MQTHYPRQEEKEMKIMTRDGRKAQKFAPTYFSPSLHIRTNTATACLTHKIRQSQGQIKELTQSSERPACPRLVSGKLTSKQFPTTIQNFP